MQVYALIASVCVVCLLNYFTFRSFYTEFDEKFRSIMEEFKQRMIEANKEIEEQLKDEIMEGEEPNELVEFGQVWRKKIQVLQGLQEKRNRINGHIRFQYYLLIFGLVFAFYELLNPWPITTILDSPIHLHLCGWIFTLTAGVFLVLNHRTYLRLNKSLRERQEVDNMVCLMNPAEDDGQIYRINTNQDEPISVEQ